MPAGLLSQSANASGRVVGGAPEKHNVSLRAGIIKFLRGYFGKNLRARKFASYCPRSRSLAGGRVNRQNPPKAFSQSFFPFFRGRAYYVRRYEANKMDRVGEEWREDSENDGDAVLFSAVLYFRPARRLGAFKAHFIFKGNMPIENDVEIRVYTVRWNNHMPEKLFVCIYTYFVFLAGKILSINVFLCLHYFFFNSR